MDEMRDGGSLLPRGEPWLEKESVFFVNVVNAGCGQLGECADELDDCRRMADLQCNGATMVLLDSNREDL